jgi:recombination protein RecA
MYNEGISKVGDVLDIAVAEDIVEKRGSFYSYGDTRLGHGREDAKQFLHDNEALALEVENRLRETFNLLQRPVPIQSEEDGGEEVTSQLDLPVVAA